MRSLKVGWLILYVFLAVLVGSGYYSYAKQTERFDRHSANIAEIKKLQEEQEKLMNTPADLNIEKEVQKLLSAKRGELWFMEDIEERLGARVSPSFLLIGPLKREDKANHIRFSRQISLEATFPELVRLFNILEKKRHFTVSQLKIARNSKKPKRHRIDFWLSTIKVKENFIEQLGVKPLQDPVKEPVMASLLLDIPWLDGQKISLGDELYDPFFKLERKKITGSGKKSKVYSRRRRSRKAVKMVPIDLTHKYTLQGIVKVGSKQIALIAPDRVLELGDLLDKKELIEVHTERIVLQKGKQKYFIRLPGATLEDDSIIVPGDGDSKEKNQGVVQPNASKGSVGVQEKGGGLVYAQ